MEKVTLAALHEAVLRHLQNRDDVVVFGAQAVNAYVEEPRMTEDVDILSLNAGQTAHELRDLLAARFQIATRVREVIDGRAFRVYQLRTPKNRHIVDVRHVDVLPPSNRIAGIQVPTPEELVAEKVVCWMARRQQPKGGTDWRDIAVLLLRYPDLKVEGGAVAVRLEAMGATPAAYAAWSQICTTPIEAPDEGEGW